MKTLNIIICDDNPESIEIMSRYIFRLGKEMGVGINITTFTDGDLLISSYRAGTDILFLDIEMPLVDGLEAAKEIRTHDERVVIVFMSQFERYAIKGYYAGAWRYLLKPVNWEEFRKEMEIPVQKFLNEKDRFISVKNTSGLFSVPIEDIYYMEVNSRKNIDIHTQSEVFECYQPLSSFEVGLPQDHFYRCHNSFILNFDYIARIEDYFAVMRNNERVEISRRKKKEFLKKYMDYSMRYL